MGREGVGEGECQCLHCTARTAALERAQQTVLGQGHKRQDWPNTGSCTQLCNRLACEGLICHDWAAKSNPTPTLSHPRRHLHVLQQIVDELHLVVVSVEGCQPAQ